MAESVTTLSDTIQPQATQRNRLNARRRQETIARRAREKGVALPVTSRMLPVCPELRDEIRRRVIAEGGGPGDVPLIIREAGWLGEELGSPWWGDQRLHLHRIERFAMNFSRSWAESESPTPRVRPAKSLSWVEPNIRQVEVVSAVRWPGRTTTSFEARARFGRFGLVARSFWNLEAARGWLKVARQAFGEGRDPREVETFAFRWRELEAAGREPAS